jgi:hypothetical protein
VCLKFVVVQVKALLRIVEELVDAAGVPCRVVGLLGKAAGEVDNVVDGVLCEVAGRVASRAAAVVFGFPCKVVVQRKWTFGAADRMAAFATDRTGVVGVARCLAFAY